MQVFALTMLGKFFFPHYSVAHDGTNIPKVGNLDDKASREALFLNVSDLGGCSSALADSLADSYANMIIASRSSGYISGAGRVTCPF